MRLSRHIFVVLAAALLLHIAQVSAQVAWTITTEYPATSMPGEGLRYFAEALFRESAGRIVVNPGFDASSGIKSSEMIAALRDGRVTAGDAFAGAMGKTDPLFLLSSLPFLAATNDEARRLTQVARPSYGKRLAAEKLRLLYTTPWPPSGIWAKKAIVSPGDLQGLAIRTYDSTGVKAFTAAGAAPVNLSFADAMPKLIDGSVVAVLSSGDGGAGRKLWDYLPYFTEINYAVPLSLAMLSESAYSALPPDLRAAVDRAATATEANQWHLLETRLAENYGRMAANGVTLVKASAISTELRTLLSGSADEAIAEWKTLAGDAGVDLLKQIGR